MLLRPSRLAREQTRSILVLLVGFGLVPLALATVVAWAAVNRSIAYEDATGYRVPPELLRDARLVLQGDEVVAITPSGYKFSERAVWSVDAGEAVTASLLAGYGITMAVVCLIALRRRIVTLRIQRAAAAVTSS